LITSLVPRARTLLEEQAGRRRWLRAAADAASPAQREVRATRRRLARKFLSGSGIEIGALHLPLAVPSRVNVRYVDRMDKPQLREEYPELATLDLVDVDVIDDGETLATFADRSVDFVIANHMIEHTQNPIATIRTHARVLKPGGTLFMAVPDKRYTFDVERPVTTLDHLIADEENGPELSKDAHYEEYARFISQTPGATTEERKQWLLDHDYSIHFHVWTPAAFAELLTYLQPRIGLRLEALVPVRHEFIAVLTASSDTLPDRGR